MSDATHRVQLPADPTFSSLLIDTLGATWATPGSRPFQRLLDAALVEALHTPGVQLADIVEELDLNLSGGPSFYVSTPQRRWLNDLFHHISLALPQGRQAPRLDDTAIVAASIISFCRGGGRIHPLH